MLRIAESVDPEPLVEGDEWTRHAELRRDGQHSLDLGAVRRQGYGAGGAHAGPQDADVVVAGRQRRDVIQHRRGLVVAQPARVAVLDEASGYPKGKHRRAELLDAPPFRTDTRAVEDHDEACRIARNMAHQIGSEFGVDLVQGLPHRDG